MRWGGGTPTRKMSPNARKEGKLTIFMFTTSLVFGVKARDQNYVFRNNYNNVRSSYNYVRPAIGETRDKMIIMCHHEPDVRSDERDLVACPRVKRRG